MSTYLSDSAYLIRKPLDWQKRGLRYTRSGYGKKIPTEFMAVLNGRMYRVYVTIFSNAGTAWITVRGQTIIVPDHADIRD